MAEVSRSASAPAATEASDIARAARDASRVVAAASTAAKDAALRAMSRALAARKEEVLAANRADVDEAECRGMAPAMIARLRFGEDKLDSRRRGLEKIAALADPVGQPISCRRRPNGMQVSRVRVPLGVVLNIYEARPHVTINAGAFCLRCDEALKRPTESGILDHPRVILRHGALSGSRPDDRRKAHTPVVEVELVLVEAA